MQNGQRTRLMRYGAQMDLPGRSDRNAGHSPEARRPFTVIFAGLLVFAANLGGIPSAGAGTFTVNTLADSGVGSLRDAVAISNSVTGPDTISFAVAGTIYLLSEIAVSDNSGATTITGGGAITLDGSGGSGISGLMLTSPNNVVSGLTIINFPARGIGIAGANATGNVVQSCKIGTDGSASLGNGVGISITVGATNTVIGGGNAATRNIISGNGTGIVVGGASTGGNIVRGNYIGTNQTGTVAIANSTAGIVISLGTVSNTIGGSAAGDGNVISGNTGDGIIIRDTGTTGNLIQGNIIGLNAAQGLALANGGNGIAIKGGAGSNTIGGSILSLRNFISGNNACGIVISDAGTSGNYMQGNVIGTNGAGAALLGNVLVGVSIRLGATNNGVGGLAIGSGNQISGNGTNGVEILDPGTDSNFVQGNLIGTNASGTAPLTNGGAGVLLQAGNNTVGGASTGAGNVISGNTGAGIAISGPDALGNHVEANIIGADITGKVSLDNLRGVLVEGGASNNVIGGVGLGQENVIAFNKNEGVAVADSTSLGNSIRRNLIHDNAVQGIALGLGANNGIAAPLITSLAPLSGVTLPYAQVDIYVDAGNQGALYLETVAATTFGDFLGLTDLALYVGKNVTATATDIDGNTSEFSIPLIVDLTPPTVQSVTRSTGSPSNGPQVAFIVVFSEAVSGVDASDFVPAPGPGLSGARVVSISGTGASYTVMVDTGSGDGTLGLAVVDDDSIIDASKNPLGGSGAGNGGFSAGETYLIDKTAPSVLISAPSLLITDVGPVSYTLTYVGADTITVSIADLAVQSTGTAAATVSLSGTGTTRTVTLSNISGQGTLAIVVGAGTASDAAGNVAAGAGPSRVVRVDTAPTADPDGDGLTTYDEVNLYGTDPAKADTDGDGLKDGEEVAAGLDPLNAADAATDRDGDGLTNLSEIRRWGTDSNKPDTDGDGMPDGFEVLHRLNPLSATNATNDDDSDTLSNRAEFELRSDPHDANSPQRTVYVSPTGADLPARGGLAAPFKTIGYARTQAGATLLNPATLVLLPGAYAESLVLDPGLSVAGLVPYAATIMGAADPVISGADGAALRGVVVQEAEDGLPRTLLLVSDANMRVRNVVFQGTTSRLSTGIRFAGGTFDSTLVTDCRFVNLDVGADIVDGLPTIRRSIFSGLASHGVVLQATTKHGTPGKSLGNASDPNTGFNLFGTIGGAAAINYRSTMVEMQNNIWGFDTEALVLTRIEGPIDVLPFQPSNTIPFSSKSGAILPSTVVCSVWDADSLAPIETASITADPGGFTVTENTAGVYPFASLPADTYTIGAGAADYEDPSPQVVATTGGEVSAVSFALHHTSLPTDSDGDGLSDADENNLYYTNPNKADTDDDGINDDVEIAYGTDPNTPNAPLTSDINEDGVVNAVDVQLVINKALGLTITGDADVNRNGAVDAVDVQFVINAALGLV